MIQRQWLKRWLPEILLCALAGAVAFYVFHAIKPAAAFSAYMTRDLDRAKAVLEGTPIFFGPELSGGGHLPGGFFYYVLAPALALPGGWHNVFLMMAFLTAAAAVMLWHWLKRDYDWTVAVVGLYAILDSLGVRAGLRYFGNPSLLPLFMVFALLALAGLFSGTVQNRRRMTTWLGLALGLGLQLHMTMLLIVPPAIVLQALAPRLKLQRFTWREVWPGLLLFALLLLPWTVWEVSRSYGHSFGQPVVEFASGTESLEDAESIDSRTFLQQLGKGLLSYVQSFPVFAPLILLLLLPFHTQLSSKPRLPYETARKQALFYGLCFLCGTAVTLHMDRARYFILPALSFVLLLPMLYEMARTKITAAVIAAGVLCMAVLGYRLFVGFRPTTNSPPLSIAEHTAIAEMVYKNTGWTFDEARKRLYYFNSHPGQTMRYIYEEHRQHAPEPAPLADPPDGYILATFVKRIPGDFIKSPAEYVQKNIEPSIAAGIKEGAIMFDKPRMLSKRSFAMAYKVKDKLRYPPFFQNRSEEYNTRQAEVITQLQRKAQEDPGKTRVAVFNSCGDKRSSCTIALAAEGENLRDPSKPMRIQILGVPLALPARRMSPDWNQVLEEPFAEIHCGKVKEKFALATLIGLPQKLGSQWDHEALLAPFERHIQASKCRGQIEAITLGFARTSGANLKRRIDLPGEAETLTW